MGIKSKLFFTEQAKLSQLNLGQLESLLSESEATIYINSNGTLNIAEKKSSNVTEKNAVGDTIQNIDVENIPNVNDFPAANTAYSLIAVREGDSYKLIWGLVDTIGNYNVISGSTTYNLTIINPTFQIYDINTPDNYKFNGKIIVDTVGDGALAAKKYSIDNGATFSGLDTSSTYTIDFLGSMSGETYNLMINDVTDATLFVDLVTLLPADYSFDFIDSDLYKPNNISHMIYKSDDFYTSSPANLEIVVTDDPTVFPGKYKYTIFEADLSGNIVQLYESPYVSDKQTIFPVGAGGIYSATVSRINSGYIELGEWSRLSVPQTFKPSHFRWSKNLGQSFSVASFTTEPYVLQGSGDTIRINYDADEVGEVGEDKKLYMRVPGTLEVYQSTHNLSQDILNSTQTNSQVTVYNTIGTLDDTLFSSIYSNLRRYELAGLNPFLKNTPPWAQNATPPNLFIDLDFTVQFLSTLYISNPNTELTMLVEDISGNLITTQTATLVSANPITGMLYEFTIVDFDSIISPYYGEVVRTRFIFNPDTTIPGNPNIISSQLKYVLYV